MSRPDPDEAALQRSDCDAARAGAAPLEVARFAVVEEDAIVEKRTVTTGRVRVSKHVETHPEEIEVALASEHALVERVAIGRFVDEPPLARRDGDTWIVPVTEEVLVVEKRLWLAEELRVTSRRTERTERRRVALRKDRVEIERETGPAQAARALRAEQDGGSQTTTDEKGANDDEDDRGTVR
jgi:uncharacterized protein (TIGR02271 family)